MRIRTRAVAVAGLAAALGTALLTVTAVPASADSDSESASSGAYFWQGTPQRPEQLPANPPPVQGNADGVEAGKLAVAAAGGKEDKVSFLYFSLSSLPPGATVTRATLTLPLAKGSGNASFGALPEKVWACPAGPQGFGGEDGGALADAPERLCTKAHSPAKASADGATYSFDLTKIAADWPTVNDGVALTAADGARTTPFQVVFDSADKATLAYEFTAPPAEAAPATDAPGSVAPATGSASGAAGAGTGSGTPATDLGGTLTGSGTSTASAPADLTAVAAPPAVSAGTPSVAPPAAAVPSPAVAAVRRSAAIGTAGVLSPTLQFWLAVLGLGAALVLLSLVLGAGRTAPAVPVAEPSLLARSLAARRAAALTRPL